MQLVIIIVKWSKIRVLNDCGSEQYMGLNFFYVFQHLLMITFLTVTQYGSLYSYTIDRKPLEYLSMWITFLMFVRLKDHLLWQMTIWLLVVKDNEHLALLGTFPLLLSWIYNLWCKGHMFDGFPSLTPSLCFSDAFMAVFMFKKSACTYLFQILKSYGNAMKTFHLCQYTGNTFTQTLWKTILYLISLWGPSFLLCIVFSFKFSFYLDVLYICKLVFLRDFLTSLYGLHMSHWETIYKQSL